MNRSCCASVRSCAFHVKPIHHQAADHTLRSPLCCLPHSPLIFFFSLFERCERRQIGGAKRETRPIMLGTRYFRIASHYRAGFQFDSPFIGGDALTARYAAATRYAFMAADAVIARHRRNIRLTHLKTSRMRTTENASGCSCLFAIVKSVKIAQRSDRNSENRVTIEREREREREREGGDRIQRIRISVNERGLLWPRISRLERKSTR